MSSDELNLALELETRVNLIFDKLQSELQEDSPPANVDTINTDQKESQEIAAMPLPNPLAMPGSVLSDIFGTGTWLSAK